MKTKVLILTALLFVATAVGQNCANVIDKDERINCLDEKLEQEHDNLVQKHNIMQQLRNAMGYKNPAAFPIFIDFNYGKSEKSKTIQLPQEIELGDFYQIHVQKINLNKWSVLINSADSTNSSPLSTPSFGDLQLDVISGLTSVLAETVSVTKNSTPVVNNFITPSNVQNQVRNYVVQTKKNKIGETINNYNDELLNFSNAQVNYKKSVDVLELDISKKQLAAFDDNNQISSDLKVTAALERITNLRKEVYKHQDSLISKEKNYLVFSKKEEKGIAKNSSYKKADAAIKAGFITLKTNIAKLLKTINAEKTTALLRSILYIKEKTENYVSLPIQLKGEQAHVNVKFVPRDSIINENSYEITFKFPTKEGNYWGVDGSFYVSTLYDENFSSLTTTDSEMMDDVRFIREDVTKAEMGVATLIRYGKKHPENEKKSISGYHLVFGPGISVTKKVRPRFLLGGGFSMGKKHNLSIDGGAIAGFVERKSNAIKLNEMLSSAPESLTVSKLKLGIFIGIGYMFKL